MAEGSTSSFQLPKGETVEAYALRTPDGRTLVRTVDELAKAPPRPATGAKK